MIEDSELLRRYAEFESEEAFAELVQRRIGLVYSVALRQTHGDRHKAEDATQAVFTDLARKAGMLAGRPVLAGWLFRSAQFAAAGLMRAEQRRHAREQEAHAMENILASDEPETDWGKIRPVLDQALNEIDERDRDAIALRFFDERPFAEVGARLRLTEGAARMRVERALDKLNAALARRGITSTTAALGVALGHQAGAAMPAGLAATVTATALANSAATAGVGLAAFMSISKLQVGIAGAVALAGATGYFLQAETNAGLRREIAALRGAQQEIVSLRVENDQLATVAAEIEQLRHDDGELTRLAQGIAETQKANIERGRLARQRENQVNAQRELDRKNKEGNELVDQYKMLAARSRDQSLTADERAKAEADTKLKLVEIQAKQREVQALKASAQVTSGPWYQARVGEPGASVMNGAPASREQWTAVDDTRIALRIPQADPAALLSVYERVTQSKITRDASIAGMAGTFDLEIGPSTKEELMARLRAALRDRMNIVLARTSDGSVVAKAGPPP